MKIKLNQVLVDIEGKDIKKEGDKNFELKDACVNALLSTFEEEKIDGNEKAGRYLLAMKIQKANDIELKVEEVAKIKELIGKAYGTLIVGQCFELLEK